MIRELLCKTKMLASKTGIKSRVWKRAIKSFAIVIVTLVGLWSIIATGGSDSHHSSGSSGTGGSVSGSGN